MIRQKRLCKHIIHLYIFAYVYRDGLTHFIARIFLIMRLSEGGGAGNG